MRKSFLRGEELSKSSRSDTITIHRSLPAHKKTERLPAPFPYMVEDKMKKMKTVTCKYRIPKRCFRSHQKAVTYLLNHAEKENIFICSVLYPKSGSACPSPSGGRWHSPSPARRISDEGDFVYFSWETSMNRYKYFNRPARTAAGAACGPRAGRGRAAPLPRCRPRRGRCPGGCHRAARGPGRRRGRAWR